MYGRKARMAEAIQKIIEGGKPPSNTNKNVEHSKNEDLMNLKRHIRRKYGTTICKLEPIKTVADTVLKTADQWRFKGHVFVTHSRSLRIRC